MSEKARRARGRLRLVMSAVLLLTAIFMLALGIDLDPLAQQLQPFVILAWAVLIALAVYTAWRIPEAMDNESNTGRRRRARGHPSPTDRDCGDAGGDGGGGGGGNGGG
jgi:hypothetical protein